MNKWSNHERYGPGKSTQNKNKTNRALGDVNTSWNWLIILHNQLYISDRIAFALEINLEVSVLNDHFVATGYFADTKSIIFVILIIKIISLAYWYQTNSLTSIPKPSVWSLNQLCNYLSLKQQFEFHGAVWLRLWAPSTRYLSWTHHYHVKWKQGYQERWGLSVSSSGCCNIIILQYLTCIWIMGLCEFERAHKTCFVHNVACHAHMVFLHIEAWTKWLQSIKNDISEAFL